jgi:hypothetical protein
LFVKSRAMRAPVGTGRCAGRRHVPDVGDHNDAKHPVGDLPPVGGSF